MRHFESASWFDVIVAGGAPRATVDSINRDVNAVRKEADVRARIEKTGSLAEGGTQAELIQFIDAEKPRLGPVIKAANIRSD